jgi:hypothetical protein
LTAYLDRLKKLQGGAESAVNIEYLKQCTYRYLISSNSSEKQRLAPVIATVLNFTPKEKSTVEEALTQESKASLAIDQTILSDLNSSFENWLGFSPADVFGGNS